MVARRGIEGIVARIPADEVARNGRAHRDTDAGGTADAHRGAGRGDDGAYRRPADRIQVDVARADQVAVEHVGIDPRQDYVLRIGAGAADRDPRGAAAADRDRGRRRNRIDHGIVDRPDDNAAGRCRRAADRFVGDIGGDIVVDLVLGNRYADRHRDARGAAEGRGNRCRAGDRIDRRTVVRDQADGIRGHAAVDIDVQIIVVVAVDEGVDVGGDLVEADYAGTADANPGGAATGDRGRAGQHQRVDAGIGIGVQRQRAARGERRFADERLHLGRCARIAIPADVVLRVGNTDRCADPGGAADPDRNRRRRDQRRDR